MPPLHKLFWLIGSGNFHEDQDVGEIGRRKKQFIEVAQMEVEPTFILTECFLPFEGQLRWL